MKDCRGLRFASSPAPFCAIYTIASLFCYFLQLQQQQHSQSSQVQTPPLQPSQQSSVQQVQDFFAVLPLQQSQHLQSSQEQVPPLQPSQHLQSSLQQQASFDAPHASAFACAGQESQVLPFALSPPTAPAFEQPVSATANEKRAKTATPRTILLIFVMIIPFGK